MLFDNIKQIQNYYKFRKELIAFYLIKVKLMQKECYTEVCNCHWPMPYCVMVTRDVTLVKPTCSHLIKAEFGMKRHLSSKIQSI